MQVRITESESYLEMAAKIFTSFEIGQSCTIMGTVMDEEKLQVVPRGQFVLDEIRRLDIKENMDGGRNRRRKYIRNSIGGWVAQKIFKYDWIDDNKVNIWRYQ